MVLTSSEVIAVGLLANTAGILSSAVRDSQSIWAFPHAKIGQGEGDPQRFQKGVHLLDGAQRGFLFRKAGGFRAQKPGQLGKIRLRVGTHEPHVFRVNGGKPFAVRDVEQAADRMFDAVRGGTARVAYGDARERASQRHPFPCS